MNANKEFETSLPEKVSENLLGMAANLCEANKLFREGKYELALKFYEKIQSLHDGGMPKSLRKSLEFNLLLARSKMASNVAYGSNGYSIPTRKIVRNPVFLMVNPSHGHEAEVLFWTQFVHEAKLNGFSSLDVAFRKYDPFDGAKMVVHPARLNQLGTRLLPYAELPTPEWVTDELIDLYVDWEHRRWQLEKYLPEVRDGCFNLAKYIDYVVNTVNPALILTTNKIDPPNNFAYLAAKHYEIEYRFLERSPFNTHIVESSGMFNESTTSDDVVDSLLSTKSRSGINPKRSQELKAGILGNPYGFRASEASTSIWEGMNLKGKPLFFLPLDNCLWTGWAQTEHPQGVIDYPLFGSPEKAIKEIAKIVEDLGGRLIIKPHPSCKEWPRISKSFPKVEFTEADLDQLCEAADVVITFLTKVAYLAIAKGKPVLSFGGGLLDNFGVTYQVRSQNELKEKFRDALERRLFSKKESRFLKLLPVIEKRFHATGETAAQLILKDLRSKVVINHESDIESIQKNLWEERPKKKVSKNVTPIFAADKSSCDVIFDISRLTSSKLRLSGVSRYIEALARYLSTDPRIKVIFGFNSQVNEFGMSAWYFSQLQLELGVDLVSMNKVMPFLGVSKRPRIYHSPINPLPNFPDQDGLKRVITIHDIFHLSRPEFYSSGNYITKTVLESIDVKNDGLIFVSDYSRKDYEAYIKDSVQNSVVTHLAVDENFSRPSGKSDKQIADIADDLEVLSFPCQGDPRKGFDRMVGVARSWLMKKANRIVVVFGSEEKRGFFENTIQFLTEDVRPRYIYLANLSDEQMGALYHRSIAQLYLSEAEGFGLPPLEALAAGCPSIMLSNTSLGEVYKDWSYLLPSDADDKQILERLDELSSLGWSVRMKAKQFSSLYTWKQTANKTVEFYLKQFDH